MKSLKIAALGVAAFGLAALPVAGVFAAEGDGIMTHKDALQININPVCTFGTINSSTGLAVTEGDATNETDQTTHTNSNGTWAYGNSTSGFTDGIRTDTLSATMQPGTEKELGSTTLTVRCNNADGYSISAKADAADLSDGAGHVIKGQTATGFDAGTAGKSYWNFKYTSTTMVAGELKAFDTEAIVPTTEKTIAQKTSAGDVQAGETLVITYLAGIDNYQASGSYTGLVTYTLAQAD